jgi:hypothetical protein
MPIDLPRLNCSRQDFASGAPQHLRENTTGEASRQKTALLSSWDEEAWHLRFECEDANPWATISEHDGRLWTEEVVEVFFDPVGDLQAYFEIEVNPRNAICDLVLRRSASGWRKEFGWHCEGLRTSVQLSPRGWSADLHIPFASVTNDPVKAGVVWRANFFRIDRPGGPASEPDLSAWSPTLAPTFHRPQHFGFVEFV